MKEAKEVFLRNIFTYFCVLIIPFIASAFLYGYALNLVEQENINMNRAKLSYSERLVSQRLREVESMGNYVASSEDVRRLMTYQGQHAYYIGQARESLLDFSFNHSYLIGYFAYLPRPGVVVTKGESYTLDEFSRLIAYRDLPEDVYATLAAREDASFVIPAQEITLKGKTVSAITYVEPIIAYRAYYGSVFFIISNDLFLLDDDESLLIYDDQGLLISAFAPHGDDFSPEDMDLSALLSEKEGSLTLRAGGERQFVTYQTSDYNGWKYAAVIPTSRLLSQVNQARDRILLLYALTAAVGGLLAYYLAYRTSRPIISILGMIDRKETDPKRKQNVYKYIESSISELKTDKDLIRKRLDVQVPYLRSSLMDQLLNGRVVGKSECMALAQQAQMELDADYYIVLAADFNGAGLEFSVAALKQIEKRKVLARQLVCDLYQNVLFHTDERGLLVCLLLLRAQSEKEARANADTLFRHLDAMSRENGLDATWMMGSVKDRVTDVSRSYYEAVSPRGPADGAAPAFSYPKDIENKLMGYAATGEYEEIRALILQTYSENFIDRELGAQAAQLLLFELCATLYKVIGGGPAQNAGLMEELYGVIAKISESPQETSVIEEILRLYRKLCEGAVRSKNVFYEETVSRIRAYMAERFDDPNISLSLVAEHFHLSDAYLSQYFKENLGENFSSMLETLRIERAKEWLSTTEMPVKEIAERCGYSTANTFGRAFKRVTQLSASAYREQFYRPNT